MLSPTLFITYTSDMPRHDNRIRMDICYVDDATQIVTSNGTLDHYDALVVQEANRLNTFEKKWKIKTNIDKICVVALGRKKLNDIQIQGNTTAHQTQCQILGHTVTSTGLIVKHANDKTKKVKTALTSLNRF